MKYVGTNHHVAMPEISELLLRNANVLASVLRTRAASFRSPATPSKTSSNQPSTHSGGGSPTLRARAYADTTRRVACRLEAALMALNSVAETIPVFTPFFSALKPQQSQHVSFKAIWLFSFDKSPLLNIIQCPLHIRVEGTEFFAGTARYNPPPVKEAIDKILFAGAAAPARLRVRNFCHATDMTSLATAAALCSGARCA